MDDRASKDILPTITHPRPADAFDLYRIASWAARCEAIGKVRVELREGRVVQFVPVDGQGPHGDMRETGRVEGSA